MKKFLLFFSLILSAAVVFGQKPKVSELPKYSPTDSQVDSMDVVGNVGGITRTIKGYKFKKAGRDSLAFFTTEQVDDTTILICNLKGECDTLILISDAVVITASQGVKRVVNDIRLNDTIEGGHTDVQWLPGLSAFRAGSVLGSQWNVANIGQYSTALGSNTIASGVGSMAFGLNSTATGTIAIVMGQNSTANCSTCLVVGNNASGTGSDNFVAGPQAQGTGNSAMAIGENVRARGRASMAVNWWTKSKAFGSFVAGYYNDTTDAASATSINGANRIFIVGNGTTDALRHDFMRALHNGNMSIDQTSSSTDPQGVLDVRSTTTGMIVPRMTKTQRDAIATPVAGMCIYQTDNTPGFRMYNGTNWMKFTESTD